MVPSTFCRSVNATDFTCILIEVTVPSYFSVTEVAESFLELVTDETKNGEALLVFPQGNNYVTFPSFL